jgi:hypothetical protein
VRVGDGAGGFVAIAAAEGTTKKCAEQEAARLAFESLLSGALLDVLPKQGRSAAGATGHARRAIESAEAIP